MYYPFAYYCLQLDVKGRKLLFRKNPFRGVWISSTSDEYLKLQIDLYSKSVYVNRENGEPSYGFLKYQMNM